MLPENIRGSLTFLCVFFRGEGDGGLSVDSSGTLFLNGFNKFYNFHLFVLKTTTEICSAE